MIYLLTAIGQPPGDSSTVYVYTQTIQRTTQNKQDIEQHKKYIEQHKKYIEQHKKYTEQHKNEEECGPCPVFAGYTLAFALQLREKHGRTSVRVAIHKHTMRIQHTHTITITLAKHSGKLPDDGLLTKTCGRNFSVNFNIRFNVE